MQHIKIILCKLIKLMILKIINGCMIIGLNVIVSMFCIILIRPVDLNVITNVISDSTVYNTNRTNTVTTETATSTIITTGSVTNNSVNVSAGIRTKNLINNNYSDYSDKFNMQLQLQHQLQHMHNQNLSLMNKNHTDIISGPLISASSLSISPVETSPMKGWRCHCWNSTNEFENELECRCEGDSLIRIPQKLYKGMNRLTITSAGLPILRSTGLKAYASSLRDIALTDLSNFDSIQSGAFESIKNLRTIYIAHAPKLTYLSKDVFLGISDTIKTIRIIYCGLVKIPDMRHLSSGTILHMVDLEGNQIVRIDRKSVRIKTEQFILDNNALTMIDESAFYGSEIAKLSFKGNTRLQEIHQSAFAGIMSIQELDLSSTSLSTLPSIGLQGLEVLRVQNTHSLKTVPSIYNFKKLEVAWLTHSFHCCAFKFPSRHDPSRHAQRLKYLESLQKFCMNNRHLLDDKHDDTQLEDSFVSEAGIFERDLYTELRTSRHNHHHQQQKRYINTKQQQRDQVKQQQEQKQKQYEDSVYQNQNQQQMNPNHKTHDITSFQDINSSGTFSKHVSTKHLANESSYADDDDDDDDHKMTDYIQAITGSPIVLIDNQNDMIIEEELDMGEFHETTADVTENSRWDALCGNLTQRKIDVSCFPMPDALNPCEDVMGSYWLRASVWVVLLLAVFGNVAVLIVILSNRTDVSVPKFLMSHLAFADLCLGLYLLLIASIDAHSMGEYFNYAFDWQYGAGCKIAGFLTVFASHLSVFTLTIITIERWFAITHAIYLNRRIKLKPATYIMIGGWIYSGLMSALPLFGISNYSSTSICLPMEARDSLDVAYLVSILGINGAAFFVIAICYTQIYFSLGKETRRAQRNSTGEMTIAKKMALLVFTNFSCWAPIAFFGLTALAGYPLINVTKSKILLVFFYPLNSCADPYLYAIMTTQYRHDLYILLSKFGLFKQKAEQYKNGSAAVTSNPAFHTRTSLSQQDSLKQKKQETVQMLNEDFV